MKLYYEYRNSMKTGDVIAFSGNNRLSKIIQWKTSSPYSHVGIVLDTKIEGGIGKAVLMMESTAMSNKADDLSGKIVNGVQVHFLSRKLESYNGGAWWIPLKQPLPHYAAYNMQVWLRNARAKEIKYDALQAFGAGADLFDWVPGVGNDPDFSSLFCSELVTKALQVAGVVDNAVNPSEQTPADVARFACLDIASKIK